jgi:hypothetical protein
MRVMIEVFLKVSTIVVAMPAESPTLKEALDA